MPARAAGPQFSESCCPVGLAVTNDQVLSDFGGLPCESQGAETVVWAASSPELTGWSQNVFLHDCKPMEPLVGALLIVLHVVQPTSQQGARGSGRGSHAANVDQ